MAREHSPWFSEVYASKRGPIQRIFVNQALAGCGKIPFSPGLGKGFSASVDRRFMITAAQNGYPESSGLVHGSKEGRVQLYPNLTFNGQCEAAFKFYEECLHGRTVFMMTYENAPMDLQAPSDWRKKVFHATFTLGEFMFAGSDAPPGQYQKPQGFALQFNLNDPVDAERIFKALSENGTVQMPLQQTFWALRFGVLVDQFGVPWIINCEKLA